MKYLDQLRGGAVQKDNGEDGAPTEPTEPRFVSFGSENDALERRRGLVVRRLQLDRDLRIAFDACYPPMKPEHGEPVSIVVAVRSDTAGIISAEMSIPREKFDIALFTKLLDETSQLPS